MHWFSLALLLASTDLWEAGKGGYVTYRIPGMVTLGDGTILAYAEARKDGTGDWADIDLVMRRSADGGQSWTAPELLVDSGKDTANNMVAIPGKGKREVHLLYCINYARVYYRHSNDSGKTFSAAVEVMQPPEKFNVIATGPGHGIRLKSGRLLIPIWLSSGGKRHRPSVVSTMFSDDNGKSWKLGETILGELVNPSETAAVELRDGRVMMNIRNENKEKLRAVVYSRDGVSGWSKPVFVPELQDPTCMASLLRYPKGPLVFVNAADAAARRNLVLHVSHDEGATWKTARVVDPEKAAYSDLTVNRNGELLVLYEKGLDALRLEKFPSQLIRP